MAARPPNSFLALVATFAVAVAIATVAGVRAAPDPAIRDPRRSTRLTGPNGAAGLAEGLGALGVVTRTWERPLFKIETAPRRNEWLVVLAPTYPFVEAELRAVGLWLSAGGNVFAAGETTLEQCFAFRVYELPDTGAFRRRSALREAAGLNIRQARAVYRAAPRNAERPPECGAVPEPLARSAVLTTAGEPRARPSPGADSVRRDTVALVLDFAGGARAVLLADSRYVSNEDLKETDAGLLVLPVLLERRAPDGTAPAVLFDEFHHGFGPRGSLATATVAWLVSSPLGWAMLQLVLVSMLYLAARSVRFGPALAIVRRERRSQLDHVEALATGLARARGDGTAVALLVDGLRRRLGRPVTDTPTAERLAAWLDSLALTLCTDAGREAVERLKSALTQPADADRVLAAARNVEELWQALKPTVTSATS